MIEPFKEVLLLTRHLVKNLHQAEYEDLQQFVEQRERIIEEMNEHVDAKEAAKNKEIQSILKEIVSYDKDILSRMESLKQEAAQSLQKISGSKTQKKAYEFIPPPDSMFIDSKK